MNWLDIVVLFILVAVTYIGAMRGFGRTLMDGLCLYGALWLTNTCAPVVANSVHLQSSHAANICLIYALLLIAFGLMALGVAYFLYHMTLFDAGMFDRLFSIVAGFAVGMMAAHSFMRIAVLGFTGDDNVSMLIASSFLGSEMLSFTTYHSVINTLTSVPSLHRQLPE